MPHNILVIDDSYIDRLVASMLIKHTFPVREVHEVSGGRQALEWLSNQGNQLSGPLIILLDIMMPHMDGFEFLEAFDKLEPDLKRKAIVLMLSSTLDDVDVERAKKHPHVRKLLSKPLSVHELREFLT